jgi:DNA-binding NtrC family response regulator
VLVTDLDLDEGIDGIQLASEAHHRWPNLPILYISGRPSLMNDYELDARELFLPKPLHRRQLIGGAQAVAARQLTGLRDQPDAQVSSGNSGCRERLGLRSGRSRPYALAYWR